jgi:hypothetical protein
MHGNSQTPNVAAITQIETSIPVFQQSNSKRVLRFVITPILIAILMQLVQEC